MLIDEIERAAAEFYELLPGSMEDAKRRCGAAYLLKSTQWPRIRAALEAGNVCADYCHSDYPNSNEAYKNVCKFRKAFNPSSYSQSSSSHPRN